MGCGGTVPDYIPEEVIRDMPEGAEHIVAPGLQEDIDGNNWITNLLFGAPNRADPRLPNYSYFQGLLQADRHIMVAGQVRIVGGMLGADHGVASFYAGAMVTTNPFSFSGAGPFLNGGPDGVRTRVAHWEEIQPEP